MFGDFRIADGIAYTCAKIDNLCRQELQHGLITREEDYVSSLSARIRDAFRNRLRCYAQTLRQGIEMKNGVDGLIIFQFESEVKIGWYEAKWPRVCQNNYPWDKVHDTRNISHFTEQIIKQHQWNGTLALWEMFFNEADNGIQSPPYEYFGSSCIWHDNAFDFLKKEGIIFNPWTTDKLKLLLEINGVNFYSVIYDLLCCKRGKKITITKGQRSIRLENDTLKNNIVDIPLPRNMEGEYDEEISVFMEERNIAGYLLIDLTEERFV